MEWRSQQYKVADRHPVRLAARLVVNAWALIERGGGAPGV
jgi:hypothetical protein